MFFKLIAIDLAIVDRRTCSYGILNIGGKLIPVEVKSGENVKSDSLKEYVSQFKPSWSIRVSEKNFGFENNIKSVPLYAVFCLNPD